MVRILGGVFQGSPAHSEHALGSPESWRWRGGRFLLLTLSPSAALLVGERPGHVQLELSPACPVAVGEAHTRWVAFLMG